MPTDKEAEEDANYKYLVILLGMASVVLAAATVYMMQVLSAGYGADYGISSLISSGTFNGVLNQTNLAVLSVQASSAMNSLHAAMREVYLIFLLSLGMLGASFVLYTARRARYSPMTRRYTLMHSVLSVLYVAMFYLVFSSGFNIDFGRPYFLLVYFAMGAVVCIDAYLEFGVHGYGRKLLKKEIMIEPDMPYTNLVKLREGVFSNLKGNVRIVDKHFNSQAVSNLHRLMGSGLSGVKRIEVLTTREMFDSRFLENYNDFKKELSNRGVELNFMLMDDRDSVNQHERFVFDEDRAYKIPPLNIINKKSEHVVSFSVRDARSRFEALAKNAIKYENWLVKQAREPKEQVAE
jgi:hypothetical protein